VANGLENYFCATTPAHWRGYTGSWEIRDQRLYLIGLKGNILENEKPKAVDGMALLFPAQQEVFGDWYSGRFQTWENDALGAGKKDWQLHRLTFEQGVMVGNEVIVKKKNDSTYN
jgi:hypothetical protein